MPGDVSLEATLWDAVAALVSAIDGRNRAMGHSMRVAEYAVRAAQAMGWHGSSLEKIRLGALLHDIGQIYWPDELVKKHDAPLTAEERTIIEAHTYRGATLIENWPLLCFVRPYILYHQEWVDGSGYPYGIRGDKIPAEVQIVSLADVYEALRHPRIYKKRAGYSCEEALAIMSSMRARRWNAHLFDRFVAIARTWEKVAPV
jgi:putative nucleotidyltransferase with HDIG domain